MDSLLSLLLLLAIGMFLLRALPFVFLKNHGHHPLLQKLAQTMPGAVMILLVIYTLSQVSWLSPPYGIPEILASIVTIGVHLLWRSPIISVIFATTTYMGLWHILS